MASFTIQTRQAFTVTYVVDGVDTPEEAWDELLAGRSADCLDQHPGEIIDAYDDSSVEAD